MVYEKGKLIRGFLHSALRSFRKQKVILTRSNVRFLSRSNNGLMFFHQQRLHFKNLFKQIRTVKKKKKEEMFVKNL